MHATHRITNQPHNFIKPPPPLFNFINGIVSRKEFESLLVALMKLTWLLVVKMRVVAGGDHAWSGC